MFIIKIFYDYIYSHFVIIDSWNISRLVFDYDLLIIIIYEVNARASIRVFYSLIITFGKFIGVDFDLKRNKT